MDDPNSQEPLVSLTLPLAQDANPELLGNCLHSISAQTYRNFEVLVLISEGSPSELIHICKSFPFVATYSGNFNKSEARNFLLGKSKGRFILYLDVDNELPEDLLQNCVKTALQSDAKAIIAPNREAPSDNYWLRCRRLEWELLSGDLSAETPNFISKTLLEKIGGFDPSLDPLDDWGLNLALRSENIPSVRIDTFIFVHGTSSLREMIRRKFARGQLLPAFESKYPAVPQMKFARRFVRSYLKNWKLLLRSPILTLGLTFLKILDLLALFCGRLNPISNTSSDGTRPYFKPEIARTYEQIRLGDNYNRYKHYAEIRSLLELLPRADELILEIGCGTGRITDALTRKGYRIIPVDPSPVMLAQFNARSGLPNPIRADGIAVPFPAPGCTVTYSLRVIWHLHSRALFEQLIDEVARVTSQFIIIDIANKNRWRHPLLWPLVAIYFRLRPKARQAHETSQLLTLEEFTHLVEPKGLHLNRITPLDVLSPIWLRLLPSTVARTLYPIIFRFESILWRVIPPGRFLVRLTTPMNNPDSI